MTEVVDVSPVSEKGQITIPKEVRRLLNVKPGDKVVFVNKGIEIVIAKAASKKLSELLSSQIPLGTSSIKFQRRMRKEWTS